MAPLPTSASIVPLCGHLCYKAQLIFSCDHKIGSSDLTRKHAKDSRELHLVSAKAGLVHT